MSNLEITTSVTAFVGSRRIAAGALVDVAVKAKAAADRDATELPYIFSDATGSIVEIDLRGTADDVRRRIETSNRDKFVAEEPPANVARGPGRPKLGVVAREVTLLPRHWEWLGEQPGGASVALRKLVDEARRSNEGKDRVRRAQAVAYRFISTMAGDRQNFEEASRALFAADRARFAKMVRPWPKDVRDYAEKLAADSFPVDNGERAAV